MIVLGPVRLLAHGGTPGSRTITEIVHNGAPSGISSGFFNSPGSVSLSSNTFNPPAGLTFAESSNSALSVYFYISPISMLDDLETAPVDTVPKPSSVMRKSMIIPGWGQVVNRQAWKVPIIYGMLAGLTYYSILMDQNYRDYRAAFYNSQNPDGDQRFGPTPPNIDPNQNPESLRYNRNVYRNRRDLTIIGVVLAYGLNIVDAYVFAQMRDFDVSDDLSARFYMGPASLQTGQVQTISFFEPLPAGNNGRRTIDGVMLTMQVAFR